MSLYDRREEQCGPRRNLQNWSEFNLYNGPSCRERKRLTDSMKLNKADSSRYPYLCVLSNELPKASHFIRQ
jgi:hypothetical protein